MDERQEQQAPPALPHNIEAEAALLGAMMCDNRLIDQIADRLMPDHFFEPLHQRIYSAIVREQALGRSVTPVTLKPYFDGDPAMKEVGGPAYLAQLTGSGAAIIGARDFARQIEELALLRTLITTAETIAAKARDTSEDVSPARLIAEAEASIAAVSRGEVGLKELSAAECIAAAQDAIDRQDPGITCGITAIDRSMGPIRKGNLAIIAARPGMGKAQPLDALILTPAGYVEMGDLVVGQELASIDGEPSFVAGIFPQGEKQIFRVTFSDGRAVECCGEHLWKVCYREWSDDRILSTDDLAQMLQRQRYQGRLWIDRISGEWGDDWRRPIDPWLLGLLIGDGNLCSGAVRFSTADPEIIDRVRSLMPDGLSVVHAGNYDYRVTGGQRGGAENQIQRRLFDLGLIGTRSDTKFIPPEYLTASRAQRLSLLQGLMDSDGWAEKHGAIRFSTASERLAHDVCWLVRSLGGVCSIRSRTPSYSYKGEPKEGRLSYTCRIRMDHPEEAFTLQRKVERCGRKSNPLRLNIAGIEPVRKAPAQCIAVSHPSRLYVTNDFAVTHNTATAVSYAIGAAKRRLTDEAGQERQPGVLFISLEMTAEELGERMACDLAFEYQHQLPYQAVVDGRLSPELHRSLAKAHSEMRDLPIQVIDASGLTIHRIGTIVRRWKRRFEARGQRLDLVIVDYLQKVAGSRGLNRFEAITEISQGLKEIAKLNEVGVLALAQLSRKVEERPDKRPQLSDLRESGQIEQDADIVTFLLRDEYYLAKAEPAQHDEAKHDAWRAALDLVAGEIDFICAKRRKGRETTAKGRFYGAYQAVRDAR
jgi:replicative DNA helicase